MSYPSDLRTISLKLGPAAKQAASNRSLTLPAFPSSFIAPHGEMKTHCCEMDDLERSGSGSCCGDAPFQGACSHPVT
ncbi:hypothetical protein N7468_010312 [Penicillium chermesinum]|uniref:Uncharacterized protein n=1 Tax=Penicillium chermesinum TaxID=63820 RepID=A0A9W9NCJ8_9EURO|nr:uncharacterized protein N7468_010312 [Penicillium chermesinum]KAJ5217304.1 hypothetical protein N7468_010312 [Penicillium chermesinum]